MGRELNNLHKIALNSVAAGRPNSPWSRLEMVIVSPRLHQFLRLIDKHFLQSLSIIPSLQSSNRTDNLSILRALE